MLDFLTAVSLILVIEGALYALFADGMKRVMAQVITLPDSSLRSAGLMAAVLGVLFLWLLRG